MRRNKSKRPEASGWMLGWGRVFEPGLSLPRETSCFLFNGLKGGCLILDQSQLNKTTPVSNSRSVRSYTGASSKGVNRAAKLDLL